MDMVLSHIREQLYVNLLVRNLKNMEYIADRTYRFYHIGLLSENSLPIPDEIRLLKKFIKKIKFHKSKSVTITPKNKRLDIIVYNFL